MNFLKKSLPFIAITTMIVLIIGGYLFINRDRSATQYLLVPKNANSVAFISPLKITQNFIELLKRNPTILDSVCDVQIDLKKIRKETKENGINLLEDVILYTFIDSIEFKKNIGTILNVYNTEQFLSFLSTPSSSCEFESYKNGEIITIEKKKIKIIHVEDIFIVLHQLDEDVLISDAVAKKQFEAIFGDNKQSLAKNNAFFDSFAKEKNHIGIWISKQNEAVKKYTSIFKVFDSFSDFTTSFNAIDKYIEIKTQIDLIDTNFFVKSSAQPIQLNKEEIGKISLVTKPKYVKNILQNIVPKPQNYLLDYCVGGFCSSIIGYKDAPVFVTQVNQTIDPNTFETIQALDTVELSPQLNIPEIMTVIQIKDQAKLLNQLANDSLSTQTKDYWTIPNPLFINQSIYLKIKDNLLYIGTNQNFDAIIPEFTTFGMCFHLPKSINNYPPKNAFQSMGMSMIPDVSVSTINLNFDKLEGNRIYLKGNIKMVNENQHSLIILTGEILKFRSLLKGFL